MTYTDYDWITDRLAVGGLVTGESAPPFDAVLSLETYAPTRVGEMVRSGEIEYCWQSILDGVAAEPNDAIVARFDAAADQLHAWLSDGKRVLVHCYMGSSRAVTAATWYLVRYRGLSWDEAVAHVRACRAVADPNIRFEIPLRVASGEMLTEPWLGRRLSDYCRGRHDSSEIPTKIREIRDDLVRQGTLASAG